MVLSVLPLFSAGPKNISSITLCPPFLPPRNSLKNSKFLSLFPPSIVVFLHIRSKWKGTNRISPPKKKAGGEFIILPPFPDVAARAGLPLVVGGSVHEGAEADSRRLG